MSERAGNTTGNTTGTHDMSGNLIIARAGLRAAGDRTFR